MARAAKKIASLKMPQFSYEDAPTLLRFAQSDAVIRGVMGPFGCLAGETRVITANGMRCIRNFDRPAKVLSWDESKGRFVYARASASFPKGTECLYRIKIGCPGRESEWRAAGHHRVLCAGGQYRPVSSLKHGDMLSGSCLKEKKGRIDIDSDIDLDEWPILSIEKDRHPDDYWDIQVEGTHNYVTEDGTIHHNSGKSSACCWEILWRAIAQEPGPDGVRRTKWAVVRNTAPQLRDTTLKTWFHWFPPTEETWSATDKIYTLRVNDKGGGGRVEAEVLFRALDHEKQIRDVLSLDLTGAWVNEAREVDWEIIKPLKGRTNRYPPTKEGGATWSGIWMDTNPPDDLSWWYRLFEESGDPNIEIFKQPSARSPEAENLSNLAPDYYKNLMIGADDQFIKVYVDGEYGTIESGKPIYKGQWNDRVHVADTELWPMKGVPIGLGWDFGLTPSVVIGQMLPRGQLRVIDEIVTEDTGCREMIQNILKPLLATKYKGHKIEVSRGDPAGAQRTQTDRESVLEMIHSEGIPCEPSTTNKPVKRWEWVRWFLLRMPGGEPAFMLSPTCRYLRRGFNGAYHLRKINSASHDRYTENAEKNSVSHPHDALQYLCGGYMPGSMIKPAPIVAPYEPADSVVGC